jgi:hypothetical protein
MSDSNANVNNKSRSAVSQIEGAILKIRSDLTYQQTGMLFFSIDLEGNSYSSQTAS